MEPDEYQAWLGGVPVPAAPPAEAGAELFARLTCSTCHKEAASGLGPSLHGVYGSDVRLASGETAVADDAYLRESILSPATRVVAGFQPVMPSFQGQISEEELMQLISYIKSLPAGRAVARNPSAAYVALARRAGLG